MGLLCSLGKEEASLKREPYYKGVKGQRVNAVGFSGLMVFVEASQLSLGGESSHGEHTANECACGTLPMELKFRVHITSMCHKILFFLFFPAI